MTFPEAQYLAICMEIKFWVHIKRAFRNFPEESLLWFRYGSFFYKTQDQSIVQKISPETLRNKQKLIIKEMLIASVPIACFSDIYMINAFISRSSMTALLFLQEQYIFVYDVLLEALICGDTTMAAASYPKTLSEMLEYDQSIGKTKLEEQFEVKFNALRLLFVALKSERLSTFPV